MRQYSENPPTFDPMRLADLRLFLRIDDSDPDTLLRMLMDAAIDHIENTLAIRLAEREAAFEAATFDQIDLSVAPISSIETITYVSTDGVRLPVNSWDYDLVSRHGGLDQSISFVTVPAHRVQPGSIRVTAKIGYPQACDIPAALIQAICIHVADAYRNREGEAHSTKAVDRLLARFRRGLA